MIRNANALDAPALARAAGLMVGFSTITLAPPSTPQLFPAEFELASLLAANGGDGSSGFV